MLDILHVKKANNFTTGSSRPWRHPPSTQEDKMLKKRYAVYNFDGPLGHKKNHQGEIQA
jgi:hypothetical protein